MPKIDLLRGKAMLVALVILGSYVGFASTSIPSVFAANSVTFYSNLNVATIAVDGSSRACGWAGAFAPGQRVHVVASLPGMDDRWEFDSWVVNGVSVDSAVSQSTYITIGQGPGSVIAIFHPLSHDKVSTPPPEPSTSPAPPESPDIS